MGQNLLGFLNGILSAVFIFFSMFHLIMAQKAAPLALVFCYVNRNKQPLSHLVVVGFVVVVVVYFSDKLFI